MKYETKEITYYNGFSYEIYIRPELLIPEEGAGYYSIILFRDSLLSVSDESVEVFSGSGILVLSPNHHIKEAKILEQGQGGSVSTLIFSPKGINESFEKFPDTFEYQALNELESGYRYMPLEPKIFETFVNHFDVIDAQLNHIQGKFWPCIAKSYVLELILMIARNRWLLQAGWNKENTALHVVEYFNFAFSKKLTLDEIAGKFATNRTTLNALFKKEYGTSAMDYLNNVRIQNASFMLSNTGLPIATVAERTGFSDEAYFSRAFKKATGKSPSEFRRTLPHPYGAKWADYCF